MSTPISILFQGNSVGGWIAAYITHTYFKNFNTVRLYPLSPNKTSTWPTLDRIKGTSVMMVGVSAPMTTTESWVKAGVPAVNCIDHHLTAIENCPHLQIDTTKSSALQVWEKFFPIIPVPTWLSAIDRIDRWDNPTYEDRCLREYLMDIALLPTKRRFGDALRQTDKFIMSAMNPVEYTAILQKGKQSLDSKDAVLMGILQKGTFLTITTEMVTAWVLPAFWVGANIYVIDTTSITLDTTEASHIVFTHYPTTNVFINYRKKTIYGKGTENNDKNIVVYSVRSQGVDITNGTVFKGHPTAAGASLVIGEASVFPFLLAPL